MARGIWLRLYRVCPDIEGGRFVNRVVITGIGALTPIGTGKDAFWNAVKEGKCGIGEITGFDTTDFKVKIAAEVKDFDPETYMNKKDARRMDRFCQFAVAAAKLCIEDSGLDMETVDKDSFGVIVGSGVGGFDTMEKQAVRLHEKGPGKVAPLMVPMIISNIASGQISIAYGLKGTCSNIVTACSSGTNSIGEAYRLIKHGYEKKMLAGGAEAAITPLSVAGFANLTALSTSNDIHSASIPFDENRNGFVMGEGAGVLLLEEYEEAKARGAEIYAEIVGYGFTGDAYHMTAPSPDGEGPARAMQKAIDEAGITAGKVDYVNAHGTSTPANEAMESIAIRTVFEKENKDVAVSSTKSMTGHLLGAAGAIEAAICAMSVKEDFIPATIHTSHPDPECGLNLILGEGVHQRVEYAMSNSFGFGGHNGVLLVKKAD